MNKILWLAVLAVFAAMAFIPAIAAETSDLKLFQPPDLKIDLKPTLPIFLVPRPTLPIFPVPTPKIAPLAPQPVPFAPVPQPLPVPLDKIKAQVGWAQITMQNNTPFTLDLFIDGKYICQALPGMSCTSRIRAGTHKFVALAQTADGSLSLSSGPVDIPAGSSPTWTITYEQS